MKRKNFIRNTIYSTVFGLFVTIVCLITGLQTEFAIILGLFFIVIPLALSGEVGKEKVKTE